MGIAGRSSLQVNWLFCFVGALDETRRKMMIGLRSQQDSMTMTDWCNFTFSVSITFVGDTENH